MPKLKIVLLVTAMAGFGTKIWAEQFLPYSDQTRVQNGRGLYQEYCATCHGTDLRGQENWRERDAQGMLPAPPHDETGHTWHHADLLLFQITKFGSSAVVGGGYQSNMPGFADQLADAEILDVLAFIKSTWPQRVIEVQNSRN
ncbi:MAG: c-type cytochrome [Cognatishimia sp.]